MMYPHTEAQEGNSHRGCHHEPGPVDNLSRKNRDDFAYHAKAGQNENVGFRMSEKPEVILPEEGGASVGRRKKCRMQQAIEQIMMSAAFNAGRDKMTSKAVLKTIQTKRGTRLSDIPGARKVKIVATRLMPVTTEPIPITSRLRAQ